MQSLGIELSRAKKATEIFPPAGNFNTNAQLEGADVVEERARIPLALDEVFQRLDRVLRMRDCALLAVQQPKAGPLDEPACWIFKSELRDGGRVKVIELVTRAYEMGVIGETESPIPTWGAGIPK